MWDAARLCAGIQDLFGEYVHMAATKTLRILTCALCAATILAITNSARAQSQVDDLGSDDTRPWAEGVSRENQDKAREIFEEANALIMQQFFKQAAVKYREALDYWDHPAIHFNMSLALMNLDQPVELYHALKKALQHGIPPLVDETNHKRAENYLNLVSQQIAHIVVISKEAGARVTMDGKLLFVAPGSYEGVVLAGEHTVAASKTGMLDNNKPVVISAGEHKRIEMVLVSLDDLTIEKRRYPTWIPWAVLGGGATFLAAGVGVHAKSRSEFISFDEEFSELCEIGCRDDGNAILASQRVSATWLQRGAWLMYGLGGAAVTSAVVLFFLNRPTRERRDGVTGVSPDVVMAPIVTNDMSGVQVSLEF